MHQAKSEKKNTKWISGNISKELINTWDLFDTLLTRFYADPLDVFRMIEVKNPGFDFFRYRIEAQSLLDKIGKPYNLYDIYRKMAENGFQEESISGFLSTEIRTEFDLMFPIRSSIEQVSEKDIIVSDMYMSDHHIEELISQVCDLKGLRPAIRSNWGKNTGTIWPEILRHYLIRNHHGDNERSDYESPKKYGINSILITSSKPTEWERRVDNLGQKHLALLLREARLRGLGKDSTKIHDIFSGPYLTLLYAYSVWIFHRFSLNSQVNIVFLRRDGEDLAHIFSAMFPTCEVKQIDLTRMISHINEPEFNDALLHQINPNSILVDVVGTGRSPVNFLKTTRAKFKKISLMIFLDDLLNGDEIKIRNKDIDSGLFDFVIRRSQMGYSHSPLECLLQTPCPQLISISYDVSSGGVVRSFSKLDLSSNEAALIEDKNNLLKEFIGAIKHRGLEVCSADTAEKLMVTALIEIAQSQDIYKKFPSFIMRESNL
jgi:hypothetical protein